jgi:hypothetical protein
LTLGLVPGRRLFYERLGSSGYYVGGIAEQAVVRALYVESCALFTRGGIYRVVKEAMGGTLAKLSV